MERRFLPAPTLTQHVSKALLVTAGDCLTLSKRKYHCWMFCCYIDYNYKRGFNVLTFIFQRDANGFIPSSLFLLRNKKNILPPQIIYSNSISPCAVFVYYLRCFSLFRTVLSLKTVFLHRKWSACSEALQHPHVFLQGTAYSSITSTNWLWL